MQTDYVHGYHAREAQRLADQAGTLAELLHHDTAYAPGARVLEAGCGVGAQTSTLARNSPQARFTAVDISAASIAAARQRAAAEGLANVEFLEADVHALPFAARSFDHAFVCFLLEHLADPVATLRALKALLRPGGSLTVIEGDHGSTLFHPDSAAARDAIATLVSLQQRAGGDALIGRRLFPLLTDAGFTQVRVSPRIAYADASRPHMVDGFTRKTFTAMVASVRTAAIENRLIDPRRFDQGIADLVRTTHPDGVFSYTFFKATAFVGPHV